MSALQALFNLTMIGGENMADLREKEIERLERQVLNQSSKIKSMDDFSSPEYLYQELINSINKYHPSADTTMVEKAYNLAYEAHKGQKRKSGEDYIIHPICVAIILAELEMDKETIVAGLLHDVVEDTILTNEEIAQEFSPDVELLVDGVTKLSKLSYESDKLELQAENLRKMFLAMAKDIRVIIIKLADRLHNMRTMKYMKPEKQKEKSRETMDIYAPIAQRLGISKVKIELEDLSLKYLEPEAYYDLVEKVALRKSVRDSYVQTLVNEVKYHIDTAGINATIEGRAKHFFSIYKKMINQNKTIDQIYDLFAVRIIVDSVKDCYAALGIIHEMYKPIPGRFKDYIAMPKPNMYQSLHTTLIGPTGQPFEIQIRSWEMHKVAEYGIAAHWKYKEASNGVKSTGNQEEEKLSWLRQILEWQQDMSDNREFMSLLKSDLDLFSDTVFCFTPAGDVKNLPQGSTPIDFAYSIHSAVGSRMVGAKVNGRLVNIDYTIKNGDRIEIITSQNAKGPSRDWLNIVKSTQAKNKINQWFRTQYKEENIIRGKEMLMAYCKTKGIDYTRITKVEYQDVALKKYGFRDWDALLAAVGHGGLKEGQIINKLLETEKKILNENVTDEQIVEIVESEVKNSSGKNKKKSGITVRGIHDVAVKFSKCCSPIPGDEIVGFITRGRGISIHRTDCINIINLPDNEKKRLIEAEWQVGSRDEKNNDNYLAEIKIFGSNRTGLLVDISKVFTEKSIDIISLSSKTNRQGIATIMASFEIKGRDELISIMEKLRQIPSVIDIERARG